MRARAEDSLYFGENFTTLRGMPPGLQDEYEDYLQALQQPHDEISSIIQDPQTHYGDADLFSHLQDIETRETDIQGMTAWQKLSALFARQRENNSSRAEVRPLGDPSQPVYKKRAEIMQALEDNVAVIVDAETGSGKTTQIPLWLHEKGHTVWHSHPSRLATQNAHDRHNFHAQEVFGSAWADEFVNLRTAVQALGPLDAETSNMTDGLLARILMDPNVDLPENLVVVLDECHQGNKNQEKIFGLIADPEFSQKFKEKNVKFVIMSATGEIHAMQEHFSTLQKEPIPVISVEGRTYNVDVKMAPNSNKVEEAVKAIKELDAMDIAPGDPNAILIFARGQEQIYDAIRQLKKELPKELANKVNILPLYRALPPEQQRRAIQYHDGITVVVATNIAENSLTIPGLRYVIDDGKKNVDVADEFGGTALPAIDISQAELIQRIGRAGRLVDGIYVLTREDSESDFVDFEDRERFPIAEIMRTELSQDVLEWAALGRSMKSLRLLHRPSDESIERAEARLRLLGALDDNNEITQRGLRMVRFPLDTALARMLDESYRYSDQTRLHMAALCAVAQSGYLPRYSDPKADGQPWSGLTESNSSDLLAGLDLFAELQGASPAKLAAKDVNPHNFREAQTLFYKLARYMGVENPVIQKPKTVEDRDALLNCIISGMPDNVFFRMAGGDYIRAGRKDPTVRTASTRSVLKDAGPAVILGFGHDIKEDIKIIHGGTGTTRQKVGQVLAHLVTRKSNVVFDDYNGIFVDKQEHFLMGESLNIIEEVMAEPSEQVTEQLISHMLGNSSRYPYLHSLMGIKNKLEGLQARMHRRDLNAMRPLLSQEYVDAILRRAAQQNFVVPHEVDARLGIIMADEDITIDTFLSPEERQAVLDDAPDVIEVNGMQFGIDYHDKKPIIRWITDEQLLKLDEDITLPNGRNILFFHLERRGPFEVPRYLPLTVVKRARGLLTADYA